MSCLAVAFTEGKLSLSKEQSIDLDATVFSKIVSGIVLIVAGDAASGQFNATLERFLLKGKDIACGGRGKLKD